MAMVHLRDSLRPYIAAVRKEYETMALPIMRPLVMEFPDDPHCTDFSLTDTQYM